MRAGGVRSGREAGCKSEVGVQGLGRRGASTSPAPQCWGEAPRARGDTAGPQAIGSSPRFIVTEAGVGLNSAAALSAGQERCYLVWPGAAPAGHRARAPGRQALAEQLDTLRRETHAPLWLRGRRPGRALPQLASDASASAALGSRVSVQDSKCLLRPVLCSQASQGFSLAQRLALGAGLVLGPGLNRGRLPSLQLPQQAQHVGGELVPQPARAA